MNKDNNLPLPYEHSGNSSLELSKAVNTVSDINLDDN